MYTALNNKEKMPCYINDDYAMASIIARDLQADWLSIYWDKDSIEDFYNMYDGCFFE